MAQLHDGDFTEEEAAKKLGELGFTVLDANDAKLMGYSIEANGDGWGVWELHDWPDHERTRMNLSGRLDNMTDCALWLAGYLIDSP